MKRAKRRENKEFLSKQHAAPARTKPLWASIAIDAPRSINRVERIIQQAEIAQLIVRHDPAMISPIVTLLITVEAWHQAVSRHSAAL